MKEEPLSESELASLLRLAEPPLPSVSSEVIVTRLTANVAAVRSTDKTATGRRGIALSSTLVVICVCILGIPPVTKKNATTHGTVAMVEYRQHCDKIEALEQELRLLAFREELVTEGMPEGHRLLAAESLWLAAESDDALERRRQAADIVRLFADTPAAQKCLVAYPDLASALE